MRLLIFTSIATEVKRNMHSWQLSTTNSYSNTLGLTLYICMFFCVFARFHKKKCIFYKINILCQLWISRCESCMGLSFRTLVFDCHRQNSHKFMSWSIFIASIWLLHFLKGQNRPKGTLGWDILQFWSFHSIWHVQISLLTLFPTSF